VRVHPDRPDSVLIEIFDSQGINISKNKEKKIEGAYFKEDLRRAQIHEIGNVGYPSQIFDIYSTAFEKKLNVEAIRNSSSRLVVDYSYSVSGAILPILLSKFGCDLVVLNASLNPTAANEREALLTQLGNVVEALKANFGAQITANGEQLILVDEAGMVFRGEMLTALMTEMSLTAHPRGTIVVPVHASSTIEQIARKHNGNVIRTKSNPKALMEASSTNPNVIWGGSGEMGFIFPQLHPGFDAAFCVCKLIEMLTLQGRSLSQIRSKLPRVYHRTFTFHCPQTVQRSLMRSLVETYTDNTLELIDGVKIVSRQPEQWVLILPDEDKPLVHIFANGNDRSWVDKIIKECSDLLRELVSKEKSL
jgi:mannose-1-phosphate guanylyltransferase/phosphomannomutase